MTDTRRLLSVLMLFFGWSLLVSIPAHATAFAVLTLSSPTGDFIGQGGTYDLTYNSDSPETLALNTFDPVGPSGDPSFLQFVLNQNGVDNTFATVDFAINRLNLPMQPGTYSDAQRASFDISFQNRGCNTLAGSFTVTDATFGPGNTLDSFAVTFSQNCEVTMPALTGTFRYNANGPISTPEPMSISMLALGLAIAGGVCKRR